MRRRVPNRRLPIYWAAFFMALALAAPLSAPPARAAGPEDESTYVAPLADPVLEARARALQKELRCLVCQGQSIADSSAEMAGDMRSLIRERIQRGEDPESIRAWLIRRYGEWVSYQPELEATTWPLWAAPLVLLLGGGFLARGRFRRRRPT
jgi:cytochrome c-type biogenesis protein CcmH